MHRLILLALPLACLLLAPASARARSLLGGGVATLGTEAAETSAVNDAFEAVLRELSGGAYAQEPEECGSDLACHCAAARKAGMERAAFGTVARMGKQCTVELVLVGAQACAVENSLFLTEPLSEAATAARLAALSRQLLVPKAEVSQTAVKSERELDRVPAIVTVITAQQIRDWGVTNVSQLVRFVPGFEVLDAGWGDRVLQYGLPGTILIMVDGIPRNDPMMGFSAFGYDFDIDLQQVERVEFVRGPGSVLWGSNAFLGIINFISHTASRTTPTLNFSGRYGTLATYQAHGEVEQAGRWLSYAFSATFQRRTGQSTTIEDSVIGYDEAGNNVFGGSGITRPKAGRYFDLVGRVRVSKFEFLANYIDSLRYYQISPSGVMANHDSQGSWKNGFGFFQLSWQDQLGEGFGARAAVSRFQRSNSEVWVEYPADPRAFPAGLRYVQGNGATPSSSNLAEVRLTHDAGSGLLKNRALLGLSFEWQHLADSLASEVGAYEEPAELNIDFPGHDLYTVGGYLQDELSLGDFSLSAGVRYEDRVQFQPVFKMQGAALYTGPKLRAKALYAEGYRTPEGNAIYSTVGTEGNPDLAPENSRAVSAEVSWLPLPALTLTGGATWARLEDLIVYDDNLASDGYITKPVNSSARLDVLAAYAQARVALGSRFDAWLTYTYKQQDLTQDPRSPFVGFAVAPHSASLAAVGRPVDDFSCFVTVTFLSQRPIVLETATGVGRHTLGPTWTSAIGFSLRKLYLQSLSLDLTLENPLDLKHETPETVRDYAIVMLEPRSGRELLLTLRWTP